MAPVQLSPAEIWSRIIAAVDNYNVHVTAASDDYWALPRLTVAAAPPPASSSASSASTSIAIGGAMAALAVVAIIVVMLVLVRRRQAQRRKLSHIAQIVDGQTAFPMTDNPIFRHIDHSDSQYNSLNATVYSVPGVDPSSSGAPSAYNILQRGDTTGYNFLQRGDSTGCRPSQLPGYDVINRTSDTDDTNNYELASDPLSPSRAVVDAKYIDANYIVPTDANEHYVTTATPAHRGGIPDGPYITVGGDTCYALATSASGPYDYSSMHRIASRLPPSTASDLYASDVPGYVPEATYGHPLVYQNDLDTTDVTYALPMESSDQQSAYELEGPQTVQYHHLHAGGAAYILPVDQRHYNQLVHPARASEPEQWGWAETDGGDASYTNVPTQHISYPAAFRDRTNSNA